MRTILRLAPLALALLTHSSSRAGLIVDGGLSSGMRRATAQVYFASQFANGAGPGNSTATFDGNVATSSVAYTDPFTPAGIDLNSISISGSAVAEDYASGGTASSSASALILVYFTADVGGAYTVAASADAWWAGPFSGVSSRVFSSVLMQDPFTGTILASLAAGEGYNGGSGGGLVNLIAGREYLLSLQVSAAASAGTAGVYAYADGAISVTAVVPEPATLVSAGTAALMVLAWSRRSRWGGRPECALTAPARRGGGISRIQCDPFRPKSLAVGI